MNRQLSRRLNRLYKCRFFGRMYKILETRGELQLVYNYGMWYRVAVRQGDPFGECVCEVLSKHKFKEHLNKLLQKSLLDNQGKTCNQ